MRKKIAANYIIYLIITALFLAIYCSSNAQIINTFAGNGTGGYSGDGGLATAAELQDVVGVAVDDTGNVYIADSHNGVIRKVSVLTGKISTIAGLGSNGYNGDGMAATATQLNNPQQLAIDDSGNIYIAEYGNEIIRKITASTGIINVIAGTPTVWSFSGDGGPATAAKLSVVTGVALDDSGNIYIADQWNHRVRKVTKTTGIINTIAGTGTEGFNGNGIAATTANLAYPTEIELDDSGNIYFTDSWNNEVRKVTKTTGIINDFAGNQTVTTGLGSGGYSGDGGPATAAQLNYPNGMFRDDSGNIYIADWYNQVIREVAAKTGIITTIAGDGYGKGGSNGGYAGDGGPATAAELNAPEGLTLDKCGNLYIGDMFNNRVRIVSGVPDSIKVFPVAPLLCSRSSDTLTASGAGTYHWSPATGLSDTTGSVVIANPANTTTYIITGSGGCAGAATPDTIVVTVTPAPPLSVTQQPSQPICGGQSAILYVSGASGLIWTPTTGLTDSTLSNDSVTVSPTITTTYTVSGISSGCVSTGTDTVKVIPAPSFTVLPLDTAFCNGQSAILYVDSGGSNFVWTPINGITDSTLSGGDSVIISPTITTTYTVLGMNTLGCATSGTDIVTIIPSPNIPTFSQNGNVLTSSSQYDNQWYRNDTLLMSDTSQDLTITASGWYWVVVSNEANGCSTASDSVYIKLTGIDQLSLPGAQVSIYPNPFTNNLFVKINSLVNNLNDYSLQIIDVFGRTVYFKQSLDNINTTDLAGLSNGVYFISIINKSGRAIFSVVKQN